MQYPEYSLRGPLNSRCYISHLQMKLRDEMLEGIEEELRVAKSRVHELQLKEARFESDNTSLRQRLEAEGEEVEKLRTMLRQVQPRARELEPEVERLRSEREAWQVERGQLLAEVYRMRPMDEALAQLAADLAEMRPPSAREPLFSTTSSPSPTPASTSPRERPDRSKHDTGLSRLSLSQQHSMWIGLPSLRQINSVLYERIRGLFHDLNNVEKECKDHQRDCIDLKEELQLLRRSTEREHSNFKDVMESSESTAQSLKRKCDDMEKELARCRSARLVLDQIKTVLPSFPGGVEALSNIMQQQQTHLKQQKWEHQREQENLEFQSVEYDDDSVDASASEQQTGIGFGAFHDSRKKLFPRQSRDLARATPSNALTEQDVQNVSA